MEEGSIHSCDTEGYYTTFHDFDGLQEVLADVDLVIHEEREEGEEPEQSKIEEDEAVAAAPLAAADRGTGRAVRDELIHNFN